MSVGAVVLWAWLVRPAIASPKGIVVRLESRGTTLDAPVVAVLVTPEGTETRIPLADDGAAPDVNTGDGVWSGTTWTEGDRFTVHISAGARSFAGGEISWNESDISRDLAGRINGDVLELSAELAPVQGAALAPGPAEPQGPNGSAADAAPPTPGETPGAPGATPGEAPSGAAPSGSAPLAPATGAPSGSPSVVAVPPSGGDADTADPSTLYIAFGVGLVSLAGVGWLWARSRSSAAASLERLPEAGLFGPGTPPLGAGPVHLVIAPADRDDALPLLLRTLAAFRPVVTIGWDPPPVAGGPVYRPSDPHPAAVGDALDGLLAEGRAPAVLLVPGPTGDALAEWRDMLPKGVGALGVVERMEDGAPAVELARDARGWFARTGELTVRLQVSTLGLDVAP